MNQQTNNQSTSNFAAGYPENNYSLPSNQYVQEEKPINWRRYLYLFLSNWYWFMITLGIAFGIAFFRIRYTIPKYEAKATLIIEEDEGSQDLMGEFRSIRYLRRRADMANEIAKLESYSIAKRTINKVKQDIFWTAHGRIRKRPLYENPLLELEIDSISENWFKDQNWFIDIIGDKRYRLYQESVIDTLLYFNQRQNINGWLFNIKKKPEKIGHNTYSFVVNKYTTLAKNYREKLQIETDEEQGTLITLKLIGTVGEREVDYLNAICTSYIISGLERKQSIAENTFHFIDEQIVVILDSLEQAEDELLKFRLSNNVINLSREGELAYEQLKDFNENKKQLNLNENYYNYLSRYVEERKDPQTIITPTLGGADDQILIGTVIKLQELYEERENLDFSVVSANSPSTENLNARIKATRLRILEVIDGLMENNALVLAQINTQEQSVIKQLKNLPLNEQELLNIKRKYDLYNQFYTFLLQRRAEAGIQKASTISNARVLDPAQYDQIVLVGNNKNIIIILALLFGILIPASIFFLIELLDNRIREREDIINHTNLPIVGIIGHSLHGLNLPIIDSPNSSFSEALRRIRTNLQFMLRDTKQKVIMVTSSVSGEGKTFTASNLAAIFALNNKKVLLIGCDMRKPSLHRNFNVENTYGLSSVIIGKKKADECIFETSIQNLSLLPSGPIPPNPAELLETGELKQLFEDVKKKYDYIILDTPPVALVSDSLSLAEHADMTLYVIRQNFSLKDVINIANQLDEEKRLPKMGLLINDIKPSRSIGYNYYYGYSKGYNYGYYDYSNYYTKE